MGLNKVFRVGADAGDIQVGQIVTVTSRENGQCGITDFFGNSATIDEAHLTVHTPRDLPENYWTAEPLWSQTAQPTAAPSSSEHTLGV